MKKPSEKSGKEERNNKKGKGATQRPQGKPPIYIYMEGRKASREGGKPETREGEPGNW